MNKLNDFGNEPSSYGSSQFQYQSTRMETINEDVS